MGNIRRIIQFLDDYLEKTMIVLLSSTLVFCLSYSAFVRYFVSIPFFTSLTHKTEELALFAFVWLLYWGACLATKDKAHFRIDAHFGLLPEKWRRWQNLPGDLLWIGFNLFVVWQGLLLTHSAIRNPEHSLSLGIHMAVIYSAIPLTFAITILRMVQIYWRGENVPPKEPQAAPEMH